MRQVTEEQKAKAQERREKFRAMVKQVAQMSDEERQAILALITN